MRTPLNAIISMLECLEKDIDDYLKRVYVKPCLNSARLLLSLLNDILDHA
jgi:signal transduction histidine kinase